MTGSDSPRVSAKAFRFLGWETDDAAGTVALRYAFAPGEDFCETLDFGAPLPAPGTPLRPGFEAAIEAVHLAAGISYYKAFLPPEMELSGAPLGPAKRGFFQSLYENGLGEFSARNDIPAWDFIRFPAGGTDRGAAPAPLPRRTAVPVGGGKDSLVSIEALRAADEPMVLFAVNPKKPILDCVRESGLPFAAVTRRIDPKLFALNDAGALNGHIPITAIVSLIAAASAFVHGFDAIALSNERSANEGNMAYGGRTVNHQYSKTLACERDLAAYIRRFVAPNLAYFSLLRPLSEMHIARQFAKCDRYDEAFTSCNRAFTLRGEGPRPRWCCDCPKCRFAFLILAAAMPPERLTAIFGRNLLDEAAQQPGYEELTGLAGHKPWECVGEIAESAAALLHLAEDPAWRNACIVRKLMPALKVRLPDPKAVETALMTPSPDHLLPEHFERVLHAYLG